MIVVTAMDGIAMAESKKEADSDAWVIFYRCE